MTYMFYGMFVAKPSQLELASFFSNPRPKITAQGTGI